VSPGRAATPVPPANRYLVDASPSGSVAPPPIPFEPAYLDNGPYNPSRRPDGPVITIMPGPRMRSSRRGLVLGLGVLALGGVAGAAWFLRPEGATDWGSRVKPFRFGTAGAKTGEIFIPSAAAERPCPLLLLLEPNQHGERACTRYARRCEEHGWIAVSPNTIGSSVTAEDESEAALVLEYARENANVDATRPIVAGFDAASEVACRLALSQPDVFGGAILECPTSKAWRDVGARARPDVRFFLFTRDGDPNREKVLTMKDEMERRGLHVEYSEASGGHQAMERDELDPAFAWLDALHGA
jgi:predicted esterase